MTGGWDQDTGVVDRDLDKQIQRAFENVDLNLRAAGGKGWDQVGEPNSPII